MNRLPLALAVAGMVLASAGSVQARQIVWHFNNLERIGGYQVTVEGAPHVKEGQQGPAIHFNGQNDSLLIDGRPLIAAKAFTIEAVFKPEGGSREQRFMHIAATDPATGQDTAPTGQPDSNARFMFEIRVLGAQWYLDTYVNSAGGGRTLAFPEKQFPLGRWYAVAQTYDGRIYRSYVEGELQGEAAVGFVPHGPGRVRVGARMNRIDHFKGAVASARFTDRALPVAQMLRVRP